MNFLDAANEEWKSAMRERNPSENSVQKQRLELGDRRGGKLISTGDFFAYAIEIVKPTIKYFIAHMTVPHV